MNTMTNAELKSALKTLMGCAVKVRNAPVSSGDGIHVFLPRAVRLDAQRLAAAKLLIEEKTGRVDLFARFDVNRYAPNYSIQSIFE